MDSTERAKRWLTDWFGETYQEAAMRSLAHEFEVAKVDVLRDAFRGVSMALSVDPPPCADDLPGRGMDPEGGIPQHEPWPDRRNTTSQWTNWTKNESDIDSWP